VTADVSAPQPVLVEQRIGALRRLLVERDAVALRLESRRDFAWLTVGGLNHVLLSSEQGVAPIVVTASDAVALTPINEQARIADEELAGLPLRTVGVPWFDQSATDRETRAIAGDGPILSGGDVAAELETMRTTLEPIERERMRAIAGLVDEALAHALDSATRGTSEHEVAARAGQVVGSAGARLPVILVAADERIERYRHAIPTDTRIERRVMVVVVAEKWGLHVAATRFRDLRPRGTEVDKRAAAIDDVMDRMRAATVVGNTFDDVLTVARAAYAEHELSNEWELHHQGGSIGYAARERIASPGDRTPIRAGMAFAWNPSAVGYKAETTLLLDSDGNQETLL
jgi:Xaa-Pro aminopeptidase